MSNPYQDWGVTEEKADTAATSPAPASPPEAPPREKKRSTIGCFVYGCLGVAAMGVLAVVIVAVSAFYFAKGKIAEYTAETPMPLPVVEVNEERVAAVTERIERFVDVVEAKDEPDPTGDVGPDPRGEQPPAEPDAPAAGAPRELVLTADEINLLIASRPELRDRVHITIRDGQVQGQVSIPTDRLPWAEGRYFNATATFDVELRRGVLRVALAAATVKGKPVPAVAVNAIGNRNLAEELADDAEYAEFISRFESIEVRDNEVVLRLRDDAAPAKPPAGSAAPEVDEPEADEPEADEPEAADRAAAADEDGASEDGAGERPAAPNAA